MAKGGIQNPKCCLRASQRAAPRPRKGTERSNRPNSSTIDDQEFYVSVASTLDSHDTPDFGMNYSQKALLFPPNLPPIRTCRLFLHILIWGEVLCKFFASSRTSCTQCSTRRPSIFPLLRQSRRRRAHRKQSKRKEGRRASIKRASNSSASHKPRPGRAKKLERSRNPALKPRKQTVQARRTACEGRLHQPAAPGQHFRSTLPKVAQKWRTSTGSIQNPK